MLEYEDVTKDVDVSWVRAMYENPSEEQMAAGRKALLSGSVGGEMPIQIAKARGASFWDQNGPRVHRLHLASLEPQRWRLPPQGDGSRQGAAQLLHPRAHQLRDHAPPGAIPHVGGDRPRATSSASTTACTPPMPSKAP